MNYTESLDYLKEASHFSPKDIQSGKQVMNLDTIENLMSALGNPHQKLQYIHVAGTNGKGSSIAMLNSIFIESGYTTGTFTSPYLIDYIEMITIGNTPISKERFAYYATKIKMLQIQASEYEILFAIAILYFYDIGCDIVLLEVCLGGTHDVTNCIPSPLLALITSIGFDHMQVLGDTLESITSHKAGIIKQGCKVVSTNTNEVVKDVIQKRCTKVGATYIECIFATNVNYGEFTTFDLPILSHIQLFLKGRHQVQNATGVIYAVKSLQQSFERITDESIRNGLLNVRWQARFEIIHKDPTILIDGSHNLQGVQALAESLQTYFPNQKITFVMGVLADKDYKKMVDTILPFAKQFYLIDVPSPRALSKEELSKYISVPYQLIETMDSLKDHIVNEKGVVCCFGSLYYIGKIRQEILG